MRIILEYILEPKFSKLSHGFRPNRGCHSALAEIRYWNGIKWLLEGDIKGFFDNINHNILSKFLEEHFNDQRFIDLYWKFVRAGYVEFDNLIYNNKGVPQGSIISPILSNLYLNSFDKYIESIQQDLDNNNKGLRPNIVNPEYVKIDNKIQNITKYEKLTKKTGKIWKNKTESPILLNYEEKFVLLCLILSIVKFIM